MHGRPLWGDLRGGGDHNGVNNMNQVNRDPNCDGDDHYTDTMMMIIISHVPQPTFSS